MVVSGESAASMIISAFVRARKPARDREELLRTDVLFVINGELASP